MSSALPIVHGSPSYRLATPWAEAFVTATGGHLAPWRVDLGEGRVASPLALPPWEPAELPAATTPEILRQLRGDFFCLPFGDNPGHGIHGTSANLPWQCHTQEPGRLVLEQQSAPLGGATLTKEIVLRPGHRALYQEHTVRGLDGAFSYGHHAILHAPPEQGGCLINVAPFHFASTKPPPFENPAAGEYGTLRANQPFATLGAVPLKDGTTTNLHRWPDREGYEDLVMLSTRQSGLAWTAATFPQQGYVWLALKDAQFFPSTLFWMSNGGRHSHPWRGRHRHRIGLEEVMCYYCDGLDLCRQDLLRAHGVPTTLTFRAHQPMALRMVWVVHPVPADFGLVTRVVPQRDQAAVVIIGEHGHEALVPVDWKYTLGGGPRS